MANLYFDQDVSNKIEKVINRKLIGMCRYGSLININVSEFDYPDCIEKVIGLCIYYDLSELVRYAT